MTTFRMLPRLAAGFVCAACFSAHAGDPPAPAPAPAPAPSRNADATKARQEADRQRLIAKLRDEAPKTHEKQSKGTVLDLPIFHRHDRP
jgi:uncharacterized membrane protein YgcG